MSVATAGQFLSDVERSAYDEQGFLIVPAVFTPGEIAEGTAVALELRPGDVAIFGCFMPHRSDPNTSSRWRRLLYLSYNADSDGGDRREAHYREFLGWLRKKYAEYGKTNVYFA